MTRLRKRGTTRLKERPSLADYIKARCLKALRTAMADVMADGGDIEAKIAERVVEGVLQDPEVLARIRCWCQSAPDVAGQGFPEASGPC